MIPRHSRGFFMCWHSPITSGLLLPSNIKIHPQRFFHPVVLATKQCQFHADGCRPVRFQRLQRNLQLNLLFFAFCYFLLFKTDLDRSRLIELCCQSSRTAATPLILRIGIQRGFHHDIQFFLSRIKIRQKKLVIILGGTFDPPGKPCSVCCWRKRAENHGNLL